MELSDKDLEALAKILAYEATMDESDRGIGWSWQDVAVYTPTIHKLLVNGLVGLTYKSRRHTNYMLTDKGKSIAERGTFINETSPTEFTDRPVLDLEVLFSDIVGYDDIKELLKESLQLDKPIHVLLYGPPSIAKSMFLWDIERAGGEFATPLLGSATSHAGLWDMIAEKRPRWILVDEIEKMALADIAGLLSLMEQNRIIKTKVDRKLDEKLNVWVVAAANRVSRLPPELLSRFAKFQLTEYNASEYREVVRNVLVSREDTNPEDAGEIALRLIGKTHDVRDAVRVARLAKRVGVKRATELLIRT